MIAFCGDSSIGKPSARKRTHHRNCATGAKQRLAGCPHLKITIAAMQFSNDARAVQIYSCKACFPSNAALGVYWQPHRQAQRDVQARSSSFESFVSNLPRGKQAGHHHVLPNGHRDSTRRIQVIGLQCGCYGGLATSDHVGSKDCNGSSLRQTPYKNPCVRILETLGAGMPSHWGLKYPRSPSSAWHVRD